MRTRWAAGLAVICAALAGCSTQANVSVATSVQSKYSHVWLTIQGVWFSTSATASPEDSGWNKFALSAPITVDLATLSSGELDQIATSLKVPAGTYSQLRLIPVDAWSAVTASATAAGATYNDEADYTDSSGSSQQARLEVLNPDKGIGVATTLTVKASLAQLGSLTATTQTTDCVTGETGCTPTSSTPAAGTSCTSGEVGCTSPSGSTCAVAETDCTIAASATTPVSTTSSAASISVAVTVDGIHDLVQFAYGDPNNQQVGVLLNPHSSAYDTSTVGGIRGSIDTTNIGSSVNSSGQIDVQVTAEILSSDGSRHVAVESAQVASDGSFVVYPLPAASVSTTSSTSSPTSTGLTTTPTSTTTFYDLVIHGPQIATVIIKSVPVTESDPSSAVSVGTVSPRPAAFYTFDMQAGTAALPAGALVDLFQTIPVTGELPYVVDQVPVDPYSRNLLNPESVPTGTIDWGTYASGGNAALTTVTPVQGQSVYFVAAQAPLFTDGQLVTTLGPPASGTGPVGIAMPAMVPAAGSGTMSITVGAVTPGKYDRGELIVSHDGAIVQTVAIDSALTQNGGQTLQVQGIPAGGSTSSDNAVYYVSIRAWNSSDPVTTLQLQSFDTPVDLSGGSATAATVNVD